MRQEQKRSRPALLDSRLLRCETCVSMKVTVVVPNWNGQDYLKPCLKSLLDQSFRAEVIVVDNGSTDGSVNLVEEFSEVTLIRLAKNRGFAGGVNAGIKQALKDGADAVALLNNDAVADKDWLKNLVATMDSNPIAGIVTSKIMRADKKHLDSTGEFYSIWGLPFPRGRNEIDSGQYDKQEEVFGASGGASLYRGTTLEEIGLFDEDFFAYFEDTDLSFRAQLYNWRVIYQPEAVAYHHVGATTSKLGSFSRYHSSKNFTFLYDKNMPLALYFKYLPLVSLQLARWFVTSLLRLQLVAFIQGVARAIVLTPKTLKKRRVIQKSRKVPVAYIDSLLYNRRPPKPPKFKEAK